MTEYTDLKNNTHEIRQTYINDETEKECLKERIAEELYKILTK